MKGGNAAVKVYVVIDENYYDNTVMIEGVFITKEKAEEYVKSNRGIYDAELKIKEFDAK